MLDVLELQRDAANRIPNLSNLKHRKMRTEILQKIEEGLRIIIFYNENSITATTLSVKMIV